MPKARLATLVTLLIVGGLYWLAVCQISGTKEPWDSDAYWRFWYPVSLILSAIAGYFLKKDGWLAGVVLTFAQFPVLWFNTATSPLLMTGLLFMGLLAVPAVAIATLSGWFAMRRSA